jgi:hypothetical protein
MKELTSPFWIKLKGFLFLGAGIASPELSAVSLDLDRRISGK